MNPFAIISLIACITLIVGVFKLHGIIRKTEFKAEIKEMEAALLSQDELDSILKGIRPDGMSREEFKAQRKECESQLKTRAKGQEFFAPTKIISINKNKTGIKTKSRTYVKNKA